MHELKTYLELSEQVKANTALMDMIREYESKTKLLVELVQKEDYDPAEAIQLTNDVEYLSELISRSELYQQFVTAKDELEKVLRERVALSCDCDCSNCSQDCASKESKE